MYEFTVWQSARASSDFRVSALVQCRGGVHRASAAVLCLVMACEGCGLEEALEVSLLAYKPRLRPTPSGLLSDGSFAFRAWRFRWHGCHGPRSRCWSSPRFLVDVGYRVLQTHFNMLLVVI